MNDLISRKAAINGKIAIQCANGVEIYSDEAVPVKYLKTLPSAQPERKKGRWVKHGTGHSIYYDCSLCGCVAPCTEVGDSFIWKLSTYCPDCGAKMGNDGKRLRTVEVKKNDF